MRKEQTDGRTIGQPDSRKDIFVGITKRAIRFWGKVEPENERPKRLTKLKRLSLNDVILLLVASSITYFDFYSYESSPQRPRLV